MTDMQDNSGMKLLAEYSKALNVAIWADAREIARDLDYLTKLIETETTLDIPALTEARERLELCPEGRGHWAYNCGTRLMGENR